MWRLGMKHSCHKFDQALANKLVIKDERYVDKYVIYHEEFYKDYGMLLEFCPWCGAPI